MHAAGEILDKTCLKAFRVTVFFQYVVHDQGKDRGTKRKGGTQIFGGGAVLKIMVGHRTLSNPT